MGNNNCSLIPYFITATPSFSDLKNGNKKIPTEKSFSSSSVRTEETTGCSSSKKNESITQECSLSSISTNSCWNELREGNEDIYTPEDNILLTSNPDEMRNDDDVWGHESSADEIRAAESSYDKDTVEAINYYYNGNSSHIALHHHFTNHEDC